MLNQFQQFKIEIEDQPIHFVREKGTGPQRLPILLLHGYPDSFVRFLKLVPLLTAQGPKGLSFDVIVPSMPGYGFSDRPVRPGMNTARVARLYAQLMERLGYRQYLVHGGDLGSLVAVQLAAAFPRRVIGLHLTDVPHQHLLGLPTEQLSPAEREWMKAGMDWQKGDGAFNLLQSTRPDTLAFAVNDSPVGLAAWIIDKFYCWTDHSGDLEKVFTRDELLVNVTIYWVTQTAGSAFRLYYETAHDPGQVMDKKLSPPAAVLIADRDLVPAPREAAERLFDLVQWNRLPSGGHFLAMEQPRQLADDLFRFAERVG